MTLKDIPLADGAELKKSLNMTLEQEKGFKEKRGGTRKNAGAKPKYTEKTKTVAFRCPLSKIDELKILVKTKLSEWSLR